MVKSKLLYDSEDQAYKVSFGSCTEFVLFRVHGFWDWAHNGSPLHDWATGCMIGSEALDIANFYKSLIGITGVETRPEVLVQYTMDLSGGYVRRVLL